MGQLLYQQFNIFLHKWPYLMYKSVLVETRPLPTSICFWGLLDSTDFPLRVHSSCAAGFEGLEVQVKLRMSPAFKLFLGSLPDMTGVLSGSS